MWPWPYFCPLQGGDVHLWLEPWPDWQSLASPSVLEPLNPSRLGAPQPPQHLTCSASLSLPACLPVCLSVCLPVSLSVCLSVWQLGMDGRATLGGNWKAGKLCDCRLPNWGMDPPAILQKYHNIFCLVLSAIGHQLLLNALRSQAHFNDFILCFSPRYNIFPKLESRISNVKSYPSPYLKLQFKLISPSHTRGNLF